MSDEAGASSTIEDDGSVVVDRRLSVAALVLAAVAVAAATVATLAWCWALFTNRSRGLDATDESYYLLSALHPAAAVARQSNFGSYLHAMLQMGGGSVGGLRLVGVVLLLGVTSAAAVTLAWSVAGPGRTRWTVAGGCWAVLSAVGLTYYSLWLVTPSYNHLSMCAGLVAVSALFRIATREPRSGQSCRPDLAYVTLAWSLVVLLDVKATSAVGLLVLASVVLLVAKRLRSLVAVGSLAVGGLAGLLTSMLVAGSPIDTVRGVSRFANMLDILASHSGSEVWETDFLRSTALPWVCWFLFAAAAIAVVWRCVHSWPARVSVTSLAMLVVSVLMWSERVRGGPLPFATNGWWWFRMTAWALLFTSVLAPRWARALWLGPLLSAAALMVAAGSNNGFVRQTSFLAVIYAFGVLAQASVVFTLRGRDVATIMPSTVFAVVVSIASIAAIPGALRAPYRLGGELADQTVVVTLPDLGSVRVSDQLAAAVRDLSALAADVPAEAKQCAVDLSGDWPVSLLAMGARSETTPWLAGGFKGSSAAYEFLTGFASCLDGPVLLIENPNGANHLERPSFLEGRVIREIGDARVGAAGDDTLVVSLVEPSGR